MEHKPDMIFFDAFDTIVEFTKYPINSTSGVYGELFRLAQIEPSMKDIVFRKHFVMTSNEPRKKVCEYLCNYGIKVDHSKIAALTQHLETELLSMKRYPETLTTIRALVARGYRVGIISNLAHPYGVRLRAMIQEDVGDILSQGDITLSYEAGLMKWQANAKNTENTENTTIERTDNNIFLHAAAAAQLQPEQCLMVGNHRINDTGAARNAGMQWVLIQRGESRRLVWSEQSIQTLVELLEIVPK
jgi:FMN phosphatase YigB (HAD superfamily)